MADLGSFLVEQFGLQNINFWEILFNSIAAVILLAVGIFVGNFTKYLIKKGTDKANLDKTIKPSFINLFLAIIKWSIYLLFIVLALNQLSIPKFTTWLTSTIVIVPAMVGALLLIAVGFAIAVYLRDIIEESGILGWKTLSMLFYYFIIYIFMTFALRAALFGQDKATVNTIIIILTAIVSAAVAWTYVKSNK